MKQLNPQIGLEQELNRQIYEALQGSVVEEVLRQVRTDASDSYWRSTLEGHSFKVERTLLGHLYDLFYEVKARLGYDEKVDFYITGDASVNAFSVAAEGEGAPHIVNINSALVELMSDDELRFVIGHELGHLMNRNTALLRLTVDTLCVSAPEQYADSVAAQDKAVAAAVGAGGRPIWIYGGGKPAGVRVGIL